MVDDGLEDAGWWRARQDDYLVAATSVWRPTSPLNLVDHLERARRDPRHGVDWSAVDDAALARWFVRIDGWLDCADFDVLRLLTLWGAYREDLPDRVAAALADRFRTFRYWYTDPVELEGTDERWYWSENHRLIFHACEYLAGQALPHDTFSVTGLTGEEHRRRAAGRLAAWFDEKAVDGFSEWHSDVYYAKDVAPLVTLAELVDDPALAERAAAFCDLVLYDLALHCHRGNVGVTHGRSYMKDKARAVDQPVFGACKLCFDATEEPWPVDDGDDADLLPLNESATLLARARRYRPPAVLRRIATSTRESVDRESMGVVIDPSEPLRDDPVRSDGRSYTDPDMVPFWWDRGALTPWQLVPLTIDTLDRHRLWDADLFDLFDDLRHAIGADADLWRQMSADLHPMVNAGLLSEVHTYTWRNAHGMLSCAQGYRPGTAGFQHHIWQATLDERAIVFANHPGNGPSPNAGDYLDHDRYWTGSATLPRSAQHRRVAVHSFEPAFAPPEPGILDPFAYEPYTHAYFPTEHFDEVRRLGHWTIGRKRDGYVALWSWRPTEWRRHDPATTYTGGLTGDFDLVADGGADDVWIVELGDAARSGTFDEFCEAIAAAEIRVEDPGWTATGPHPGFDVRYESPAEGTVECRPGSPLVVAGSPVELAHDRRFDNPYTSIGRGETTVPIRDDAGGWELDLDAGTRRPRSVPR
ncbi:hypothetical protein [Dermatobacter hominis]|uniref:hypothetical protein n=1 Tax=Dermatobacter hominis TaxID=2884263 RepID=UPI001D128611|nr:hypothetical protein [Dermatobacter hominis]UDY34954.1 hypothetical protein LH044_16645 [Dermatobacter hominis]